MKHVWEMIGEVRRAVDAGRLSEEEAECFIENLFYNMVARLQIKVGEYLEEFIAELDYISRNGA